MPSVKAAIENPGLPPSDWRSLVFYFISVCALGVASYTLQTLVAFQKEQVRVATIQDGHGRTLEHHENRLTDHDTRILTTEHRTTAIATMHANQASLRDRGIWMNGQHDWAVVVSQRLDIRPPPKPPEQDPSRFGYEPMEAE